MLGNGSYTLLQDQPLQQSHTHITLRRGLQLIRTTKIHSPRQLFKPSTPLPCSPQGKTTALNFFCEPFALAFMMRTTLILLVSAGLATALNRYDIYYYPPRAGAETACNTHPLGCTNHPAFFCCEAPPGRNNFRYAKVYGPNTGNPIFHSTDGGGGCLGCTGGFALGYCTYNVPFETISVLDRANIQCITTGNGNPNKRNEDDDGVTSWNRRLNKRNDNITGIMTWDNGTTQEVQGPGTLGCKPADTVWLDGVPYHLPAEVTQEFIDDCGATLPPAQMIERWNLIPWEQAVEGSEVNDK